MMTEMTERGLKLTYDVAAALKDPRAYLLPATVTHVFVSQAALIRDMAKQIDADRQRIDQLERDLSELKGVSHGEGKSG